LRGYLCLQAEDAKMFADVKKFKAKQYFHIGIAIFVKQQLFDININCIWAYCTKNNRCFVL